MPRIKLDHGKLVSVVDKLQRRIRERFPTSEPGLHEHILNLRVLTVRASATKRRIARPYYLLRLLNLLIIGGLLVLGYFAVTRLGINKSLGSLSDFVQGLDSAKNLLIAAAVVIWSLFYFETWLKRGRAISFLDELLALAYVVNLAQQSKDPDRLLYAKSDGTKSSPSLGGTTTALLLGRYLDYCKEMVDLLSTLGAFVTAGSKDRVVIEKFGELSRACGGIGSGLGIKLSQVQPLELREIQNATAVPGSDATKAA